MHASSFAVLRLLADGRMLTHAEIGAALALSRRTVQRALREIAAQGLEVTTTRGRGSRLASAFDLLDAGAVARGMENRAPAIRLEVIDECASTNTWLALRAEQGAPIGTAVVCELQHAGRGRRGAAWFSGLGTSLTFSLLWRFPHATAALGGLSLAAGVACVRALDSLGIHRVALKWPNDLMLDGAKLGGILVEISGAPRGPTTAVAGVGINVKFNPAARRAIGQPVADLAASGVSVGRNLVLGRLLAELARAFEAFARTGFRPFREEWLRRHAYQGAAVRIVAPQRSVDGVATDIGEDGALIVETSRGLERFHAAEVSLRQAA
jgi:BirA family biotin operon repressor/biotin-[acetyl-CoA-carboxylase] ligase